ncbi:MAG: class I SAM-dependent methyltransferase [Gammaproteobacteria bacterium]|nr:class I SAM-dependent methyltransferase [Gammaproteobacteria bacterium]
MFKYEIFWNAISDRYAAKPIENKAAFNETVESIRRYLNTGDCVLDFGCGTGTYSIAISDKVSNVHGIDISKKMLKIAQQRTAGQSIENIQYQHTNLYSPKLKPNGYDAILAFNILHLQENPVTALQRITELLKPDGVFISKTFCAGPKPPLLLKVMRGISKTGWVPYVACLDISDLEKIIAQNHLHILTKTQNPAEPKEYLIVAKKAGPTPR